VGEAGEAKAEAEPESKAAKKKNKKARAKARAAAAVPSGPGNAAEAQQIRSIMGMLEQKKKPATFTLVGFTCGSQHIWVSSC